MLAQKQSAAPVSRCVATISSAVAESAATGMAGMTYLLSLTLVRMDRSWLPLHDENTRSNLPG